MKIRIEPSPTETHVVRSQLLRDLGANWNPVSTEERRTPPKRQQVSYNSMRVSRGATIYTSDYRSTPLFITPDWLHFQQLISQWHGERGATSSITKMAMCPAYQRIIAMGENAIPLILRQMENEGGEPDHWFWALTVLTGADPIPEHARGDIREMAKAWLEWARFRYAW